MNNCSKFAPIFLASSLLLLTACGSSSGGDPITDSTLDGYKIVSFDVTGTDTDLSGNKAPINSGINNGAFSVSWLLSEQSDWYTARLYLSSNDTLSSGDTEFLELQCQDSQHNCSKQITFNNDCTFDNNNIIQCLEKPSDAKDLTNILPSLPYDGFIILETCDWIGNDDCDTPQAHAVQLQ